MSYGIVVCEGRDGADAGRDPPRDRPLPPRARRRARPGPLADDRLHDALRQDGARATSRSPTSSSRTATRSCSRTCRDRHRSEGTKQYFHSATPHTGEDGYDTIEWIAAQRVEQRPDGHRRQLVRRDHADPDGAREPAAPDGDLARRRPDEHLREPDARGRRDAAAHVLGALHPRRRPPGRQGGLGEAARGLRRPASGCASSSGTRRSSATTSRSGTCPTLAQTLEDYCTRGAYDEFWAAKENDFTRFWDEHADIPATMTTGWYDPFPHADSEYFAAMTAKNRVAAAADHRAVEPRRDARRRDAGRSTSTSGRPRSGASSATSTSSSSSSTAGCRTTRADTRPTRRRCRSSSWAAAAAARPSSASSTTAARWRDEQEWPLARATAQTLHLHSDGSLRRRGACAGRRAAPVHLRPGRPGPDDRRPLLRRRRDAVGRERARAGVGAPAQPGAPAPEHHDPGRGRPEGVGRLLHRARAVPAAVGARRTCSSTRPSRSSSRWR